MKIDELINQINKRFDKALNVKKRKININAVEKNLLKKTGVYRRDIEKLQKSLFIYSRKNKTEHFEINIYSFVACVIGAKYKEWTAFGSSNGFIKVYSKFNLLYHRLQRLGRIGEKSKLINKNSRKSYIGKCAEVKAAYNINSEINILNLNDIEFTNAYRPRTEQIIDRCENCKFTFGK